MPLWAQSSSWEEVHLAQTAFDIAALAPETDGHYSWQHSAEWRAARRVALLDSLLPMLG